MSPAADPRPHGRAIVRVDLHAALGALHEETAAQVERILIEPRGVRRVVHAEFPGRFLDEIYDARIPYLAKSGPTSGSVIGGGRWSRV